jgi:integrase
MASHHNPMDNVEPPAANPARTRVLDDDEMRLILKTCDAWEAKAIEEHKFFETTGKYPRSGALNRPDYPRIIKLLFLTGCRRQEVAALQWDEVDLDNAELKLQPERTKQKRILLVPLCDEAVEILRGIPKRPQTNSVFGGRRKHHGVNLMNAKVLVNERIVAAGGTPPRDWRIHDIRRTVRSGLARLKVPKHVAEPLVGHGGHRTEVENIYDLYEYWPEKQQAVAIWGAHVRAVIDGTAEKIVRPNFGQRKKGGAA